MAEKYTNGQVNMPTFRFLTKTANYKDKYHQRITAQSSGASCQCKTNMS